MLPSRSDLARPGAQAQQNTSKASAETTSEISPDETVPPLDNPFPAIFVPLRQDLLASIQPAKSPAERLQRMQASLDANEKAVRDNLAWMCEREARRLVAHARRTRPLEEPREIKVVGWEEADKHVANITAPANPYRSSRMQPEMLRSFGEHIDTTMPDDLTPHERTVREVLLVASQGAYQMQRYSEGHIQPIRDRLNASIETAKRRT